VHHAMNAPVIGSPGTESNAITVFAAMTGGSVRTWLHSRSDKTS